MIVSAMAQGAHRPRGLAAPVAQFCSPDTNLLAQRANRRRANLIGIHHFNRWITSKHRGYFGRLKRGTQIAMIEALKDFLTRIITNLSVKQLDTPAMTTILHIDSSILEGLALGENAKASAIAGARTQIEALAA